MNAKKLHKHALPIVSFSMAILAIAGVASATLRQQSRPNLASGLTSSVISVKGNGNGLASVQTSDKQTDTATLSGSDDISDAALLYLAFHPAK